MYQVAPRTYDRILDSLYSSATFTEGFSRFLCEIQQTFQSATASFIVRNSQTGAIINAWYQGIPQAESSWYEQHLAQRDPLLLSALKQSHGFCSAFIADQALLDDLKVQAWCTKFGLMNGACAIVYRDDDKTIAMTVGRTQHQQPFSPLELEQLNNLIPHMTRAVSLYESYQQQWLATLIKQKNNNKDQRNYKVPPSKPSNHPLCPENIRHQFGFSIAEAKVCFQLCLGKSPEAIAEDNNRELCTVRSHIKALFRKTDTSRQGELVALVLGNLLNQLNEKTGTE